MYSDKVPEYFDWLATPSEYRSIALARGTIIPGWKKPSISLEFEKSQIVLLRRRSFRTTQARHKLLRHKLARLRANRLRQRNHARNVCCPPTRRCNSCWSPEDACSPAHVAVISSKSAVHSITRNNYSPERRIGTCEATVWVSSASVRSRDRYWDNRSNGTSRP